MTLSDGSSSIELRVLRSTVAPIVLDTKPIERDNNLAPIPAGDDKDVAQPVTITALVGSPRSKALSYLAVVDLIEIAENALTLTHTDNGTTYTRALQGGISVTQTGFDGNLARVVIVLAPTQALWNDGTTDVRLPF